MATAISEDISVKPSAEVLGIYHVNINCTDLDRSRAFYEMLGFVVLDEFAQAGEQDLDRGLGYDYTDCRALFMGFGRNRFETVIDLAEWITPKSENKGLRLHDIGAPRLALRVKNIDALVAGLRSKGVKFIADPQQLNFLKRKARFACCTDPDGMVIEFVELMDKNA